jgi:spermidine/putrescine transport system permease protein
MEAASVRAGDVRAVRHPRAVALGRRLLDQSLNLYAALALIYLLLPIAVIVVFSFNEPHSRFNFVWHGFTLENWKHPFDAPGLTNAMVSSLKIAALSTVVATILGTMMALALVRYQFRGRGLTNFFIFLPLATPEVVLGASLLSLFLSLGVATGFTTIVIAHIMFNISFVVVVVRSRLIGFDRSLEEAAQDLGANGLQTFLRVTLPLIAPGVLAAGLLAFALSIDDFVITYFNAGSTTTFPLFVWGAARVATPPQINVIGTAIFLVAVTGMIANIGFQNIRSRKGAAVA